MRRWLCVGLGGGIGALSRYAVQGWVQDRLGAGFPYGTLLVNISGAFLIGLLMTVFLDHMEVSPEWRLFLVVGVLGGYTTFSSLAWEAYQLFAVGSITRSVIYVSGSFFGGMAGLMAGVLIGRWI